ERAAAVEVDPDTAVRATVGVTGRLGNGAGEVRRAAVTTDPLLPQARPAERSRHGVELAEGVGVEEPFAVPADPGEHRGGEGQFQDVGVPGLAGDLEHPPVPQDVSDRGTGLVVRRAAGQLVIAAVSLMHAGDLLLVPGPGR